MFVRSGRYTNTQSFANINIYFGTFAHFEDYSYLNTNGDAHAHRDP